MWSNKTFKLGMDRISGSVSGIRQNPAIFNYPVSGRIPDIKKPDIRFSNIRRISSKPDINKTFLLLFEDLRCFNYLSNSVEQRTGIAPRSYFVVYLTLFR